MASTQTYELISIIDYTVQYFGTTAEVLVTWMYLYSMSSEASLPT